MSRITHIINNKIQLNNKIKTWIDFGSGDGKVISGLKWNNNDVEKISIERVPIIFDENWSFAAKLHPVIEKKGVMDLFTAFDCIEHLEKKDGFYLLNTVEEFFRHAIFFTPEGFLKQDKKTHPELIKNNPWQKHLSGWEVEDFKKYGYNVERLWDFHNPKGIKGLWNALIAYK